MCPLCFQAAENVDNIFVHCIFTTHIWNLVRPFLKIIGSWASQTLRTSFESWISAVPGSYKTLPCFVCWAIWNYRNRKLFEGKTVDVHIQSITGAIGEWFQVEASKKQIILRAQSFSPEKSFGLKRTVQARPVPRGRVFNVPCLQAFS